MTDDFKIIILVPLFAMLALAITFVMVPIFANLTGGQFEQGLEQMSKTVSDFSPVFGVGLAVGVLLLLVGLGAWISKGSGAFPSDTAYKKRSPFSSNIYIKQTTPKNSCTYCRREYTSLDFEKGYCGCCGAPIREGLK